MLGKALQKTSGAARGRAEQRGREIGLRSRFIHSLGRVLMRAAVALSAAVVVLGLAYVYVWPPAGVRVSREGVPLLAPPVAHPATGEPIPLEDLVRHYKGGAR